MTKSYFLFFFLDHISSSFKPIKLFFSRWTKCISWASVTLEAAKARLLSDPVWLDCWIDLHSFQFLSVFEPGLQLKAVIWGGPLSYITQRERSHLCRLITDWLLLHSKPGLRKKQEWVQLFHYWSGLSELLLQLCFGNVSLIKISQIHNL